MLGIGGLPAVIMLFGMLFMPESPRHLVNLGNFEHFLFFIMDSDSPSYFKY